MGKLAKWGIGMVLVVALASLIIYVRASGNVTRDTRSAGPPPTVSSTSVDENPSTKNSREIENPPGQELPSASVHASTQPGPPPTSESTSRAEELLLGQQITLVAGGENTEADCSSDVESGAPEINPDEPAVWLSRIGGPGAGFASSVALCLLGFFPDEEIDLVVQGGGLSFSTTIVPTTDTLSRGPVTSLFVAGSRVLANWRSQYGESPGVLESWHWTFVPPPEVRERLAVDRQIFIRAEQPRVSASRMVSLDVPDMPFRWLEKVEGRPVLLVFGFPRDARVPVGLYRINTEQNEYAESSPETAVLVRQIGNVAMPMSRTELFWIPDDVLRAASETPGYCVTVPLSEQFQVPCLPMPE